MCLRTYFCSKINKNPKNTLKIQKNQKKYFFFLNQFQILKFFTIKFLRCNIYQISNNNINYVPKANLPKQNHSSWLFKKNSQKKQKKVKNPKAQKQQPYCYTTSFLSSEFSFCQRTELFIALFNFFYFLSIFIPQ